MRTGHVEDVDSVDEDGDLDGACRGLGVGAVHCVAVAESVQPYRPVSAARPGAVHRPLDVSEVAGTW